MAEDAEARLAYLDNLLAPLAAEAEEAQTRHDQRMEIAAPYVQQLLGAGYSQNQAEAYGLVLAANAERMASLFGMSPQDYLAERFAGYFGMEQGDFERMAQGGQSIAADIAADLEAVQGEFAPEEETAGTATATEGEAQAEAAPPRNAPVVHEGVANVDDLYRVASEAQPAFNEALNGLAAATGGEVLLREGDGLKSRERAQLKLDHDYGPEGANRIVDVLGGTLLYDNRAAVEAALPVIEQEVQRLGGEVVRVKNRFERPSAGYRDYLLNIRMPNGFVTEVLLTTKAMSEAKNGAGHVLYEASQLAEAVLRDETATVEEKAEAGAYLYQIYKASIAYYASTGEDSSATASLSGIVEPLNKISEMGASSANSKLYPKIEASLGNIRNSLPAVENANGTSSNSINESTNTGSLGVPFSQGTPDRSLPSSERTMSGMVEPPVDTSNITPNGAESKSLPAQNAGRVRGADTVIAGSQGREAAHYELREMTDVIPSHDPLNGFAKRADYPEGVQERPYHSDPAEQDKVREHALKLDPIYLVTDNPDATNGPSIITESGVVLGGNSRAMSIQQAYASNPERANIYREAIKAKVGNFGLDPAIVDAMQQPMLVRVVDGDMDAQQMAVKSRLYNETPTQALQTKAEGVSRARMLSERSLNLFAEGMAEYDTLREFTAKPASRAFVESLLADGVIEKTKASTLVDQRTGLLTDDGKALVENALRGLVVADYDTLNAAAPSVLQKLDRSVPALVQLKARGEGWDMSGVVTRALQVLNAVTANKQDMDTALGQGSLLQGGNPAQAARPAVQAMALTFEKATQKEIAARFAHMVEDSRALSETDAQGLLGNIAPQNTPATSFVASFLKPVVTVGGVPVRNFDPAGNPLHGAIAWAAAHGGKGRTVEGAQAELEKTLRSKKASKAEKQAAREMIGQLAQVTGAVAEYRPRLGGYFSYQQGQPLFQFLGEQGAGRLDAAEEATTRLDNLAVAREMEQAGKDAKAVKLATGWERGADGKWRYEVNPVKLDEDKLKEHYDSRYDIPGTPRDFDVYVLGKPVGMFIQPELVDAYPVLKDIRVNILVDKELRKDREHGEFNKNSQHIVVKTYNISRAEQILSHEIQHIIQKEEGFSGGGSVARDGASYARIAGEVEARNVMTRHGMTAAERLQSLASETEDVAREDQIILRDGLRGAAMAEGATNSYGVPLERVTVIEGDITPADVEAALKELAGRDLPNLIEGITAQVNTKQRRKLNSATAAQKSMDNGFTRSEHRGIAAKIAEAWRWAAEAQQHGDAKGDNPSVTIRRFVSALNVNGGDVFAWITVKDGGEGPRIYSVELVQKEKLRDMVNAGSEKSAQLALNRSFEEIISRLRGPVNPRGANILYQREQTRNARGAMTTLPDGRAVVGLFKSANASTVLHETAHFWLEELRRAVQLDTAPQTAHIAKRGSWQHYSLRQARHSNARGMAAQALAATLQRWEGANRAYR